MGPDDPHQNLDKPRPNEPRPDKPRLPIDWLLTTPVTDAISALLTSVIPGSGPHNAHISALIEDGTASGGWRRTDAWLKGQIPQHISRHVADPAMTGIQGG